MIPFNINSRPFRQRLKLITIVATLSIIASVAATLFLINKYENTVMHISKGELLKLYQISLSFDELSAVHTRLLNLYSTATSRHDEQEIYLLGNKLITRMDTLHQILLTDQIPKDEHIDYISDFQSINQKLLDYRNTASTAIKMISLNTRLSDKYMLQAATSFNQINSHLSSIMADVTDHIDRDMKQEVRRIKQTYWPMSILLILLAIFMLSIFYRIITALSANFHFIEKSLDDLRLGNTDIEIPIYTDNNEMGKIYGSLDKFRASLIEVRESHHELSEQHRLLIEESENRLLTQQELMRSLTELSRAIDAAEASSKAKSLFLANMSHEIRTPLNAVLGMAQVLLTTRLDNTQTEYITTLYQQGQHLLQLLNSVLDFSKMESGKLKLLPQAFELDKLLDEAAALYRNQSLQDDVPLIINIDADVNRSLHGDPLRIRQILINLLSNAYKFTRQGNIIIHVKNDNAQAHCGTDRDGQTLSGEIPGFQSLYFTVTDTGIGIEKTKQQYIFDNFTQVDESSTRQYGGAGIGLAICKQLVELMDGEIGVMSEPGKGATFWFRICLPMDAPVQQQQAG